MTTTLSKELGTRTGGSGARVLRVTASESYPARAYAQHEIVLTAGKQYRLQGWLRADPTNAFDPRVWTSRVDEGGADTVIVDPGSTTAWLDFDVTFTPANNSYLRFGGIWIEPPTGDFWFEFDDMTLWAIEDIPANPILYWTAGGNATLAKNTTNVYQGEQSLSVTGSASDFSLQDVNLDERYPTVQDAFVMFDSGNGVLQSRVLDPLPPS